MNCQEIHSLIPSVSRGQSSLTELALVEVHLRDCAGCRAERERLEAEIAARWVARWSRALSGVSTGLAEHTRHTASGVVGGVAERTRSTASGLAGLAEHTRHTASGVVGGVAEHTRATASGLAGLAERGRHTASGLAGGLAERARSIASGLEDLAERTRDTASRLAQRARSPASRVAALPGRLERALRRSMTAAVDATGRAAVVARARAVAVRVAIHVASRSLLTRSAALGRRAATATTSTAVSLSGNKAVQVAGIALVVGLSLYAILPSPIIRPDSGSDVTVGRRGPHRPVVAGSRRGSEPAPPRASTVQSAAMVATTSAQSPRRAGPHVIGRLTVKDRDASERQLTDLLARSGGARIGGRDDLAATVVHAVVPSSGYRKFTRGLAQIGIWRVEAERSPLPRGVRMTIRLDE